MFYHFEYFNVLVCRVDDGLWQARACLNSGYHTHVDGHTTSNSRLIFIFLQGSIGDNCEKMFILNSW